MNRDIRIDSLKGFLIILVILGHLIGEFGTGVVNEYINEIIYTFHMPLFIFLSGYLSSIKKDSVAFWRKMKSLIQTFLIFQFISIFLILLYDKSFDYHLLFTPYWTLWYLLSLFFWRLMLQYSPQKLLNNPLIYISIAFVLSVLCGLMYSGKVLSIQRTITFYPYFLSGYYIRQYNSHKAIQISIPIYITSIFAVVLFVICDGYPDNSNEILRGAYHHGLLDIPSKILLTICTIVMSYSIFNVFGSNRLLAYFGKYSLLFYLYHGIIIKFIISPIMNIYKIESTILIIVSYCIAILLLISFMCRIKAFRELCNIK